MRQIFSAEEFYLIHINTTLLWEVKLNFTTFYHFFEDVLDLVANFQRIEYGKEKNSNFTVEKPGKCHLAK